MSMKKELVLVEEFHQKFNQPVLKEPSTPPETRYTFRHKLMLDEVNEYLDELTNGAAPPQVAKELADILYAVYGTILEHGLQDKMEDVFCEVHRSNMSKDFHQYKMIKGKSYTPAHVEQFFE